MKLYILILLCVLIGILLYTNRCEQFSDTYYGNKNNNSEHLDPSTKLTNKKASNSGIFIINKSALNL